MTTQILREAAFSQETSEVFLALLTISHSDINPSIRVVNNTQNITSRGNEFIAFPFEPVLPDQRDDAPSRAKVVISNVTREVAQAVRSISTPPDMLLEVIRADDPDTVEVAWPNFQLRNVTWNAGTLSGDLVLEDFTAEPYPAGRFSPASFPGLF